LFVKHTFNTKKALIFNFKEDFFEEFKVIIRGIILSSFQNNQEIQKTNGFFATIFQKIDFVFWCYLKIN